MGNIICCVQDSNNDHGLPSRKVPASQYQNSHSAMPSQELSSTDIHKLQSQTHSPSIASPTFNNENNAQIQIPRHGPENYQSIKYLGKGTFGNVVLAEDKETGNQYAMKIIEKKSIKEINLLQSQTIRKISQNDLFIKIRETFQNNTKIYVVMQYMPRGDIYYYLKKKACVFRQDIIKMLVAEIIVGIQLLHNEGIIYRELKPENILVTNEGHVKLGDYGLSRMIIQQKNPLTTFVGTLEYTAPQALEGHYDKKVDIWTIGILMYELKFQQNLFEGTNNETNQQVKTNIQRTNIQDVLNNIVGKVSYDFRDVLIKLLTKDPQKRITLQQLKKHPFFQGVVWQDIPNRKNPPPLKQILQIDHIKFKDPNNYTQLAHRKKIQTKSQQIQTNLYQFCQEQQ